MEAQTIIAVVLDYSESIDFVRILTPHLIAYLLLCTEKEVHENPLVHFDQDILHWGYMDKIQGIDRNLAYEKVKDQWEHIYPGRPMMPYQRAIHFINTHLTDPYAVSLLTQRLHQAVMRTLFEMH
jgi:hypothetical protein